MQQDVQGCCQLVVVDLCLQFIRHGTTGYFGLLTFFRRSKGLADTFDYDHQVFLFPIQHHLLMLWLLDSASLSHDARSQRPCAAAVASGTSDATTKLLQL